MYTISEEQRKQLLHYLMARPYAEVAQMVALNAVIPAYDRVMLCTICNSKGVVHDKEVDEYFDTHPLLKSLHNNRLH